MVLQRKRQGGWDQLLHPHRVTCTEAIDKNPRTLDVPRLGGEEKCRGLVAAIFGIHVAATRTAEGRLLLQKQF